MNPLDFYETKLDSIDEEKWKRAFDPRRELSKIPENFAPSRTSPTPPRSAQARASFDTDRAREINIHSRCTTPRYLVELSAW